MTMANGMKIIGRAFRRAPRAKAADTRNVAEMMRQRQEAERQRAQVRMQMFRKTRLWAQRDELGDASMLDPRVVNGAAAGWMYAGGRLLNRIKQ
jgi:hypothetical protein